MADTTTQEERAQISQTIEMFEVITQSQPLDYQSLEILREAYSQVGREEDVVRTSKMIADAYVQLGHLSSAILEYETLLQHCPDDKLIQQTLNQLVQQTETLGDNSNPSGAGDQVSVPSVGQTAFFRKPVEGLKPDQIEDGRKTMRKIFVESKLVAQSDFEQLWAMPDLLNPPADVAEPFIQLLADKKIVLVEKSLKFMSDKTRMAFLPIDRYEIDIDLTRTFPADVCRRWCVLPFDRMSKAVLVATANPFNQQAAREVAACTNSRLVWFLAHPVEIMKYLRKAFR